MEKTQQKLIKFHGTEVKNIIISFVQSPTSNAATKLIEEFNAT